MTAAVVRDRSRAAYLLADPALRDELACFVLEVLDERDRARHDREALRGLLELLVVVDDRGRWLYRQIDPNATPVEVPGLIRREIQARLAGVRRAVPKRGG